jgi:hypothetical protein
MSRWVYKQNLYPGTSSFVTARRIVHVGVDPTGPQDGPTIWFESGTSCASMQLARRSPTTTWRTLAAWSLLWASSGTSTRAAGVGCE